MSKPKRHHIVPECYLKSFTNNTGKFFVLPKDKTRIIFETGPNNVAVRTHYYSYNDENGNMDTRIEETFAQLEDITKPILDKIKAYEKLTPEDKGHMAVFIGLMFTRNPNFRDAAEEMLRQVIDKFKDITFDHEDSLKEAIGEPPDELIKLAGGRENLSEWLKQNVKTEILPGASLNYIHLGLDQAHTFADMHWRFWINPYKELPFISSDNPCYICNKSAEKSPYGTGPEAPGSTLHFPISPEVFLIAGGKGGPVEYKEIRDKIKVTRINSRTIRYAETEVYTPKVTKPILKLHRKNRDYTFTTLTDQVGPYLLARKTLIKKDS